eukprot:SAG31_NODE_2209_length_6183_cov_6.782544_3_plen_923_part_00
MNKEYRTQPFPALSSPEMMRFVAVVAVAFLLCAGGGAAHQVDIGSQLEQGLDVPEGLKQFLGAMVTEMRQLKKENSVLQNRTNAVEAELRSKIIVEEELQSEISWLKNDRDALENKTRVMEAETVAVRAEVEQVKKEKKALENKTQGIEGELVKEQKKWTQLSIEVTQVRSALYRLSHKMNTDYTNVTVRLDQCEADIFAQMMERRKMQDSEDTVIGDAQPVQIFKRAVTFSHLSGHVDVDESNGMHRLLAEGGGVVIGCSSDEISQQLTVINDNCCDEPEEVCTGGKVQTCNAGCAALIMPLWTSCRAELGRAANILHDAAALCSPAAAHRFLAMCPPNAPNEDCIPTCDENTHGYLLLLSIDGTDTILTCELSDSLYDWLGTSALGGFVGENVGAFLPAVISGAAGAYVLKLMEPTNIVTDLVIQPSQKVVVSGDQTLQQPPPWGSGKFTVSESASLSLSYVRVDAVIQTLPGASNLQLDNCLLAFEGALSLWASETTFKNQVFNSGLVIPTGASVNISGSSLTFAASVVLPCTVQSNATLSLTHTTLSTQRPGDDNFQMMTIAAGGSFSVTSSQLVHGDSRNPIPCNGANMVCAEPHTGAVVVTGHASINTAAPLVCTDDVAPTCLTSYVDVPSCLEGVAQGLQSCFVYLEQDTGVLGTIAVDAGEEFEIYGTPAQRMQASWTVRGSLGLHGLRVAGGSKGATQISVEAGGQLIFDQVQMEGGRVTSAGVVSVTESTLINSELTIEPVGVVTVTHTVFRSTLQSNFTVVSVAEGGSMTVGGSQLVRVDGSTDPFPCDGPLPKCGEHDESVVVDGPLAINMLYGPLVCDVETGECQSMYRDLCLVGPVDCGIGGTCASPYGTCTCNKGYSGDHCETHLCCSNCWSYGCSGDCLGHSGEYYSFAWCEENHRPWDADCDRTC